MVVGYLGHDLGGPKQGMPIVGVSKVGAFSILGFILGSHLLRNYKCCRCAGGAQSGVISRAGT